MMFSQLTFNHRTAPAAVKLSDMLNALTVVQLSGPWDAEIAGVTTDSREVRDRWMFVAVDGENVDGHRFVQTAMERGASCVVVQLSQYEAGLKDVLTPSYTQHNLTTVLVVHDTRKAVGLLADAFYRSPASSLKIVGITGTNGKTTTSFLLKAALEAAGEKVGLIGTIAYHICDHVVPARYTTPPAEDLHRTLADIRDAGCTAVVMEVSSHALELQRVAGISFACSIFTNLTQDHLDFHGNMEAYREAKTRLFSDHTEGFGILNSDDPASSHMGSSLGRKKMTYGKSGRPSVKITSVEMKRGGLYVGLQHQGVDYLVKSSMSGSFNAYNIAAAFTAGVSMGYEPQALIRGLQSISNVEGRFERILSADGVTVIVDYSHTPDSLEKAISTAREIAGNTGRVLTVFGCGGDRDRGKRPLMGRAASRLSDIAVITSDNPRGEDPMAIIEEILTGVENGNTVIKPGRRAAIQHALRIAEPGDIVLVAGKGHEAYQIVGRTRRHFDDREIVRAWLAKHRGGVQA